MLIKQSFLVFLGLTCGLAVASGVFAFITMLGIIPRLSARTNTATHIYLYETAIILGGTLGNIWILFELPLHLSWIMLGAFGLFSGMFVGCLAMALAEVLRVLPIMINRAQIKEGFPIVVFSIALGKMAGTLFQYFFD
jgi:stage V sporulation protein AB